MMTFEPANRAYVWVWLPDRTEPIVAGVLRRHGDRFVFNYGRSYLGRDDAVSPYQPELPLHEGVIEPPDGLDAPGCITDAGPDSWGQRIIEDRLKADGRDPDLLDYLLHSGSDRFGTLDFQDSAETYRPREGSGTLSQLLEVAERVNAGDEVPDHLAAAALRGTSVGGARPKATVEDGDRHYIAKFPVSTDSRNVVGGEALAMELAGRVGLDVAPTRVVQVDGRDVLLVERFDREPEHYRRRVVSALTVLELADYPAGRYATYTDFANRVRQSFSGPDDTLRELFARISFNMCVTNTDDHARNHAAFVDDTGSRMQLRLTPAFDICPQLRTGDTANQAMAYGRNGQRETRFASLVAACGHYHLDEHEARDIIDRQVEVVQDEYDDAADAVGLPKVDRDGLRGRQVLHPSIAYGYDGQAAKSLTYRA